MPLTSFVHRHGQNSSFSRQVNGWGFKRIMSGCDYNSYYNPVSRENCAGSWAIDVSLE